MTPPGTSRAAALASLGLCLSMILAAAASAQQHGGAPPSGGAATKTNANVQQVINQLLNGIVQQEKTGADRMNGFADFSQFNQHAVVWEDEEATSLSPSDPNFAAGVAAANAAAFKAMDQITQADLDNAQNINVDNFVGGSADGGADDAEDAAMQDLVNQATVDTNGQTDPDLAGAADLSGDVQTAALAAIYAGYNIDSGGLTVTTLDYYPPFPSDVMTSLDLQPALCGH